jgi:sugar transferase (PEP-CTERM/EpsH1 system associated)
VPNLIRVRPYNLLRFLAARGHRVTLLTLSGGADDERDLEALRPYCQAIAAYPLPTWRSLANAALALPSHTPLQAVYCWQAGLAHRLETLAASGQFDLLHVEHLRGVRYADWLSNRGARLPIVWDSVDCISLLFKQASGRGKSLFSRLITRVDLPRTERYEGQMARRFSRVLVTSSNDRRALAQLAGGGPDGHIAVLPNGVDLDYFQPSTELQRDEESLVISGKMSYHANVAMVLHLVNEIMPLVWARRPGVKVTIVGKDPAREVLALAGHPRIEVTGTVSDIRPYLQRASLAVTPITYGAGIQNKVLEAMACGTPVVSSPQAVSALEAEPGQDVIVAEDPLEFSRAILALLADPRRRAQVGAAGLAYARSHHRWDGIASQLECLYDEAVRSSGDNN